MPKKHEFREHARAGSPMEGTGSGPTGRFAREAQGALWSNILIDIYIYMYKYIFESYIYFFL